MKQAIFTKSLTISMPLENYEHIKQITDEQRISMAEWTRAAIDTALANHQREEEVKNDN